MKNKSLKIFATTLIFSLFTSGIEAQKIGDIKNLVLKFVDYKCTDPQNWTNNKIILIFADTTNNKNYHFTMYSDTSFDFNSRHLWVNANFGRTDCDDKTASNIGKNYSCKLKYELVNIPDENDEDKVSQTKAWLVISLKNLDQGEKRTFDY